MKNKYMYFFTGSLIALLVDNFLIDNHLVIKNVEASRSAFCEPIVKSSIEDFRSELTLAKDTIGTRIVSSNLAIDSNGSRVYYALLCSN